MRFFPQSPLLCGEQRPCCVGDCGKNVIHWHVVPMVEGDMACNTLPYKIAALREAHQEQADYGAFDRNGNRDLRP
jgi:hypothetical protein